MKPAFDTGPLDWRPQILRARPEACFFCGRMMQRGTSVLRSGMRFMHADSRECEGRKRLADAPRTGGCPDLDNFHLPTGEERR